MTFNPFVMTIFRQLVISVFALIGVITLILFLLVGTGCAKKTEADEDDLAVHKARAKQWCKEMEHTDVIQARCDRLVFTGIANGSCAATTNALGRHIYDGAAYHRDVKECFRSGDSQSECSPDGLIGGLNATVRGRGWIKDQLVTIKNYLEENDYICGEGPESLTNVSHLRGQLSRVIGFITPARLSVVQGWDDVQHAGVVPVHSQYLSAIYLDTERILRGRWTDADGVALRLLALSRPNSAPIQAMAGHHKKAVELLNMQFTEDEMPLTDGHDNWGSAPDAVLYAWAVSLLGDE